MTFGRRHAVGPHEVISFVPWKVPIRYRASWHLEGCWTWSGCQFRNWIAQPTHAKWGSKLKISLAWKKCEQLFKNSTQLRELNWFLSEIVTPAISAEHGSMELSWTPCTQIKILDIPWSSVLCLRVSLRDCVVQVLVSNIANTALCWDCHVVAFFVVSS